MHGMSYASDLTDEQWALLEPVFNAPGKRGPKHAPDLRRVVDAMLYISHTGCQFGSRNRTIVMTDLLSRFLRLVPGEGFEPSLDVV